MEEYMAYYSFQLILFDLIGKATYRQLVGKPLTFPTNPI